jgi:acylphosphatase
MSPADASTKKAEIYVEGQRNKVEGFVRWCERSKVGLGQSIRVERVVEEEPTGLYEHFYATTE